MVDSHVYSAFCVCSFVCEYEQLDVGGELHGHHHTSQDWALIVIECNAQIQLQKRA